VGLNDTQVKRLVPREDRYEVLDGDGLYLRVFPSGVKSWIFRYNFEKAPRRMTLGKYPTMGLAEARKMHRLAMDDVEKGIDPGKAAQAARIEQLEAPTFKALLDEFWDQELRLCKTADERRRLVDRDATPVWGDRKVAGIKRRDVVLLVDSVRKRAPITANRLLGVLSRMFAFAAERGIIEDSPATKIKRPSERPRERVLSDEEIRLFWEGLDKVDVYPTTKLALRFVLVTGQRAGEVTGLPWAEVDGEWWGLPPDRMKEGKAHRVPLSPLALEILNESRNYSNDSGFVFTSSSRSRGEGHITPNTISRGLQRHLPELGITVPFVPHDLRRTVRTKLAEIGVEDAVAEKVLGHQLQGVLKVYNRHTYDQEKMAALLLWERRLREILWPEKKSAGKVIRIR